MKKIMYMLMATGLLTFGSCASSESAAEEIEEETEEAAEEIEDAAEEVEDEIDR